jgi:hypothetical protein
MMKKPRFDLAKLQPRQYVQPRILDFDDDDAETEPETEPKKFENIAVPFCHTEDGRCYLTERQLSENPYLRDFVDRFRDCFTFDMRSYTYWFEEKKP